MSVIEAELIAGEAYQVVGDLALAANLYDHPEVQRALDWFSGFEPGVTYKDGASILPWPKEELKPDHDPSWQHEISSELATENAELTAWVKELEGVLSSLVNAKALSGVRAQVAGWNGENRTDGVRYERHTSNLGAKIQTNCGRIYELDEIMQVCRCALAKKDALKPCRCGQPATTSFDGEMLCEACAREDAHRDLEEQEMPGGYDA